MITVEQSSLVRALTTAATPISGKSPMPILNCLVIEAAGGSLSVVGSNLDTIVRAKCPAAGTLAPIAVPASIADRAKLMPAGPVTLAVEKGVLLISSGKRKFKLETQSAADFPASNITEPNVEHVDGAALSQAMQRGLASMSPDSSRMHLHCAMFVDGTVRSTDGSQCSVAPSPVRIDTNIPRPAAESIAKFISGAKQVRFGLDGTRIVVSREDATISCQTVDITRPPIDVIFKERKDSLPAFTVDRAALVDALRAVSAACGDLDRAVDIKAGKGTIRILANNSGEDELQCEGPGSVAVRFSANRMISVLATSDGEQVTVQSAGELDPIFITGATTRHIVMPMRS
jgi:DNA polymerase-3 subunit beta